MKSQTSPYLLIAFITYTLATTLHFFHNGYFLEHYPNMPAWLSRGEVFFALGGVYLVGFAGCLMVWFGARMAGYLVICVYAILGFDGLAHYGLASFSSHTAAMNFTIWFEVLTGALLLFVAARRVVTNSNSPTRP